MSARGPPNLRHWLGGGIKEARKLCYRRKFWVGAKNCEWKHYCKLPEEGSCR